MKRLLPLFVALSALFVLVPLHGFAETTIGAAIETVPYVIKKPGVYHFTKDLTYTASTNNAIRIDVTGVVVDLNGYSLISATGASAAVSGTSMANGIVGTIEDRITVKNGTIRGFQNGVVLTGNYNEVSGMSVIKCLKSAITIVGNHSRIVDNRIYDNGDSADAASDASIGITLTGTYGVITGNDIQNIFETDNTGNFSDGIRILGCSDVFVGNNRVLDVEPAVPTKGASTGISVDSSEPSENVILLGNTVLDTDVGFDLSGGSSGKYGDNITGDVGTSYYTTGSGMTSIDSNN